MANKTEHWTKRFGMKVCAAAKIGTAIPAKAPGVAVIFAETGAAADGAGAAGAGGEGGGEKVYLVVESRAGSLREQCAKRLQTAKLPEVAALTVAYRTESAADESAEAVNAACREQVVFAGEVRRALRPAMR